MLYGFCNFGMRTKTVHLKIGKFFVCFVFYFGTSLF